MEDEIIPENPGGVGPWNGKRLTLFAGIVACILIAGAGVSAAAVRYDSRNKAVVLQGVEIGGVSIGGMPFEVARFRLIEKFEAPLQRGMTVEAGDKTFAISPAQLGARTDALAKLEEVTTHHRGIPLLQRIWLRFTGAALGKNLDVRVVLDEDKLDRFIATVKAAAERPAKDVSFQFVDGRLQILDGLPGYVLDAKVARSQLKDAIESGASNVRFAVETSFPALGRAQVKDVLVVTVGENKLYHFRNEEIVKTYEVATGLPRYPTPLGQFTIVNKRKNPTWVNPAKYPGGWGWSLPARIGPGPRNPLGTRALDLSAKGIRIHGTSAGYSIGYNASHGCIRMRISESEELFELVGVGTPVLIVRSGAFRSIPASSQPRQQEPTAESDATVIPGQTEPAPQASPSPQGNPGLGPGQGN